MKEVLFVILEQYADWEAASVAAALNDGPWEKEYTVKTVSVTGEPVRSIGGFTTLPDYDIDSAPAEFAALLLIGGKSWREPEAAKVEPLVRAAVGRGVPVGAICDATVFMGMHGFLNGVKHTSNGLPALKSGAQDVYTGEAAYQDVQAVSDGRIITANGTANLEFAREVLLILQAAPRESIDGWYDFNKLGFCEIVKRKMKPKNSAQTNGE